MIPTHTLNNIAGTPARDERIRTFSRGNFRCDVNFDHESDPSELLVSYEPSDFTGEFRTKGVRTFEQIKASVPTTPASIDGAPGEGLTSFSARHGWSFLVWRYPDGALLVIKFFTKDSGGAANALDLTGPALEVGKIVAPQVRDLVARPTASPT
ncbi:phosphoribosylaminoimidazole carboxylase, ATPase subunit [Actinomyces sp. Chiba101]|uniref:hypothetical protein n=1 Tax=Actinomyces TaxID=1654 RepID=UPI000974E576|nr:MULTISPECIES: hypothetical protein [Actinomyces]BAW94104.1 phosphoribosylaminoimidazole carboxylase, ATPase subunit [Actinomyces sp. Chiba101]GAV95337.1 phosphoribosylaminoimidazole carboxylase, ATPase subunit [Actinomyces denticolens]